MPIITRLDGRSELNKEVSLVDKEGNVIATFTATCSKVELAIATAQGFHIEKPNGFSSKK